MKTIIIGKNSNLSKHLQKKADNCVLVSARDILLNVSALNSFEHKQINIIFNNFQPATQLGNFDHPKQYIDNTISSTAIVLDFFKNTKINKIIYTSSSSVYGQNSMCDESYIGQPLSLHSGLKIANELLIKTFCENNNIDYTIARVFNMYGGDDKFSIISKLINTAKNSTTLKLFNNGSAIRDFIHIDNVVEIYIKLLTLKNIPILNVGSGVGESVHSLIKYLKLYYSINVESIETNELKKSIADNRLLLSVIKNTEFISVKDYIKNKLNL